MNELAQADGGHGAVLPLATGRLAAQRLRLARTQLLDDGQVSDGLIHDGLRRSWQRSQAFGLAPAGRMPGAPHASAAQLARALARQHELVAHARPVMSYLAEHMAGTHSLVILADARGMLLQALGDGGFVDRAGRVALRPGAVWHEQWRGTNAIGTALAEGRAVVVHGSEHYLDRNAFLTCSAAPVVDPAGRLLGVLDVSVDRRHYHPHTTGLLRAAAGLLEHRLFDARHRQGLRLRLHPQREGLGTVGEGLLALSDDGSLLLGANARALQWLGLGWQDIGCRTVDQALGLAPGAWLAQAHHGQPVPLQRPGAPALWLQAEAGRPVVAPRPTTRPVPSAAAEGAMPPPADRVSAQASDPASAPASAATPVPATVPATVTATVVTPAGDALAALDLGDAGLRQTLARARRVLDKPIALLLQGESGAGKEVLARAVHDSSQRRSRPFVAVNCAALPESLIEAELFGYRPGAFTGAGRDGAPGRIREAQGGTLFLDEIGDMPLLLQARLLRVLQDKAVLPLGGGPAVAVDFRLVCATHRDLRAEMQAGRFREDLYYRLNGLALRLPPLRERSDFVALAAAMLADLAPGQGLQLAPALLPVLAGHRWPGNLRQLHNTLQTSCALLGPDERLIDWPHLGDDLVDELQAAPEPTAPAAPEPGAAGTAPADTDLRRLARRAFDQVMADCAGNRSEAARRLGISRNTLYRRLRTR